MGARGRIAHCPTCSQAARSPAAADRIRTASAARAVWEAEIHLSDYGVTVEAPGLLPELRDQLCDEAALRGCSVWELVTRIVGAYLDERR